MSRKLIALIVALMVALGAMAAIAQGRHPGAQGKQPGVQGKARQEKGLRIAKELGLTQDQITQIKGILKTYHENIRTTLKSDEPKEQKRTEIKALRDKAIADAKAVLTPDQLAKAEQMKLFDRAFSFRHGHGRGMKALWVMKQLNLTPEQKAQVKSIVQDARTQAKAIKDNTTLTKEQKVTQFRELHESTMQKIKALLTPDQLQKLEQMKQNRPQHKERAGKQ